MGKCARCMHPTLSTLTSASVWYTRPRSSLPGKEHTQAMRMWQCQPAADAFKPQAPADAA
jgi:hypothetical protein